MKRPFLATLTVLVVLILASWNALRAWTFIAWQNVLAEYSSRLSPQVGAAIGAIWFIIGLILAWGIWQSKTWSAKWLLIAAVGYSIWYWVERLVWQNPHPNNVFVIVFNLASLIYFYFVSKSLSREAYERNTENPTTE